MSGGNGMASKFQKTFERGASVGILGNGLNLIQVSSYIQNIVIGAIIVGAVWIDLARERRR